MSTIAAGQEYTDEKFQSLALPQGDLTGAVFEDCVFTRCDFKETDFTRARFIGCQFVSCDLSNAKIRDARLSQVTFEGCKLVGVSWSDAADLVAPAFRECHLSYGSFVGLNLKKTEFTHCHLLEVDFSQTDLTECNLRGSDLYRARFNQTTLLKADLRRAMNYEIDPIQNKVRGARFSLPEAQGLLTGLGIVLDNGVI